MMVLVRVRDPGGAEEPRPDAGGTDSVSFRVPTRMPVVKLGLAALVLVGALVSGERLAVIVGVLAAVGLTAYGLRDLLAPVRLAADATGLDLVRGYAARRHLDWSDVERVHVDERLRLGVRSQLLEIDADVELYLFSRFDLGTDPADAADAVLAVRPADH
jgi:hypothetical protein